MAKAAETQRLRTIASPAVGVWKRSCQAVSWLMSRKGWAEAIADRADRP
jgi:hypothetical protein